ncbi:YceI family protein [Mesorhizobium sp. 1B3]|uniref:YceI family protein n=1 Tax=Mesorhizobium sp. 1B3 TaxID=3243599 RepID=UPI003D953E29
MIARAIGVSLLLALPAVAAVSLGDAAGRYVINAGGSTIAFSIPKAGGGALSGTFGRFRGDIRISGQNIASSQVDITIFPDSVRTGESRTDAFLKSDAVFDTANEKEIRFRSTSVKRTGDSTAVVSGPLTARGRTGNESFNVELESLSGRAVSFRVTGRVLRSRYGMDVGTPIYSNIVDFDMTLAARRG